MACKNCFNGCTEITSDKCVKYTGIDIPALGISNGDTLLSVESSLISFLTSTLNGSGIKPVINQSIICSIITEYLPTCTNCTGFTLNDILHAIINATCDIQEQLNDVKSDFQILNADYQINCLSGVTNSSDTHDVLQAVINKLCSLDSSFSSLLITLPATYVLKTEIDDYIDAYLQSTQQFTAYKNRMIPYAVVPYFGPLTNFNISGQGQGVWDRIFLCNGLNGTPDMRGRVPVGTIVGVGGGTLDAAVNPANSGNPNYAVGQKLGANEVTLGVQQIPAHTHTVTTSPHTHGLVLPTPPETLVKYVGGVSVVGPQDINLQFASPGSGAGFDSTDVSVNDTTVTATAGSTGGGEPHSNIQPVIALHYITYIP